MKKQSCDMFREPRCTLLAGTEVESEDFVIPASSSLLFMRETLHAVARSVEVSVRLSVRPSVRPSVRLLHS